MTIQAAIAQAVDGHSLTQAQMRSVMRQIMTGECTPAQIGGLLVALRMKGETVEEITAAAEVMASLASHVDVTGEHAVDIVGTGGDSLKTFNISTAAAFVAAGAGATVAKHGNRSVSSSSGSADLLEQAGADLELDAEQVAEVIAQSQVGFMFAPMHHSAMRHAIGPRKEMAIRTLFNVLGPLTNPAKVKRQVVGVFEPGLTTTLAKVLRNLGSEHALVVYADDGMDEISVTTTTQITEVTPSGLANYLVSPEQFGIKRSPVSALTVKDSGESWQVVQDVLNGQSGAPRDIVLLNAGAAIYVSGLSESLALGVEKARQSIDSGNALRALQRFVSATQSVKNSKD